MAAIGPGVLQLPHGSERANEFISPSFRAKVRPSFDTVQYELADKRARPNRTGWKLPQNQSLDINNPQEIIPQSRYSSIS